MAEIRIEKGRLRKGPLIAVGLLIVAAGCLAVLAMWEQIEEALPKGKTRIVTTIYREDRSELKVESFVPRFRASDPKKILEVFGGPKPVGKGKMIFSPDIWCTLQSDPSKGELGTKRDCKDLNEVSTLETLRLRQRLLDTKGVTAADLPPALRKGK